MLMLSYMIYRGPQNGARGKIMLLFEGNPISKVGVRFDKPINDGVDLGGLCDVGYGYFCNGMTWHHYFHKLGPLKCCFLHFFTP